MPRPVAGPSQAATNWAAPPAPEPRVHNGPTVARERRQECCFSAESPVHPHRVDAGRIAHLERADHEPADADDVDRGGAPHFAERVESVLKEAGRGVEPAGPQALDDLLVEERVHLAIGVGRDLGRAIAERPGARERAELVEAVHRPGRVRPVGHEGGGAEDREAGEQFPRPATS